VTSLGAGTPAGTVTFNDGGTALGTATLDAYGYATLTTSSLSVNIHTLTAVYGGNSDFDPSTSGTYPEVVNPATATVSLSVCSYCNPSYNTQPVTFTAYVFGH